MYSRQINRVKAIFDEYEVTYKNGMSEDQFIQAQGFYNIAFPPDYKELLKAILPISFPFYDWSDYSIDTINRINKMLAWPIDGTLFDVKENDFWLKSWGEKPPDMVTRLAIARDNMEKVPKLIPVCSHRYISSFPEEANNPIYSVYQMDVIVYGDNLWEYFEAEFRTDRRSQGDDSKLKVIPFWHDIVTKLEYLVESYQGMLLPTQDPS
jgi:hypothetical protein